MRRSNWLAMLLCLCLLFSALPTTMAEELEGETEIEAVVFEDVEPEVGEVDSLDEGIDLGLEGDAGEDAATGETPEPADSAEDEAALAYTYAKVRKASAPFYYDDAGEDQIASLAKGEVVLVLGREDGLWQVAINVSGRIIEGYMKPAHLTELSQKRAKAYQGRIASEDAVALYQDSLDWPLGPVGKDSDTSMLSSVTNGYRDNFQDLSNDTAFTMNGVTIRAGDEPTKGAHNCWKWAQAIYKKVWGCNFDSTFAGTAARGHNLVRNLTDDERTLTPEHLKYFVTHAKPGATLRVQSCPSSCSGFNTDGCSRHNLHSLIIAEIREDGLVTIDDQGKVHTRFYTWEGFCNAWARWKYVKYIKWPNAPALPSAKSVDGYTVTDCDDTYRVRAIATGGVSVMSLPTGGKALAMLTYPATFKASKKALQTVDGKTWVYGESSTGVTGWLALTDDVVNVKEAIAVTGVALDQTTLLMARGGTATLKAVIAPLDATERGVEWSSSNTAVATVSDGVVTAVASGECTITATTKDGGKKAACAVRVADADASKALTRTGSNGTVKLPVGQKLQLIPTFATSRGWKIKGVSSSKTKYATVSKAGVVKAKKVGTTLITVKTKNGKKATLKVKVVAATTPTTPTTPTPTPTTPVEPTSVRLNKSGTIKMKVRTTKQLIATLLPAGATSTLTWVSTNPKVVYIDNNGKLYALKRGTCTVGVMTANGKIAKVKVKVS